MGVIGIEEIFLKTKNMEKALEFYNGILGIPIDKRDDEKTYLQMDRGHLVLQIENHTGLHQGGGPLHFAMTVTEETFDEILGRVIIVHSQAGVRTACGIIERLPSIRASIYSPYKGYGGALLASGRVSLARTGPTSQLIVM